MVMKRSKDIPAKEAYKRLKLENGHNLTDQPPAKMTKLLPAAVPGVEQKKTRAEKKREKKKEKRKEKKEKKKQEAQKADGDKQQIKVTQANAAEKKRKKRKKKKKISVIKKEDSNVKTAQGEEEKEEKEVEDDLEDMEDEEDEENILDEEEEDEAEIEDEESVQEEQSEEFQEDDYEEDIEEEEDEEEEIEEEEENEEEDIEEEDDEEEDIEEEEEEDEDCSFSLEAIDPISESEALLASMLRPVTVQDFFKNYWEKKPLVVKRKHSNFYSDWFSTSEIDEILRQNRVMFTEHLDVTSYVNGKRETHNPEGRAFPAVVWDSYRSGCSIRMLCPQAFSDLLAFKLNLLQEYFGCFVGSNAYLTPPGTQGFAPHYDDIEAFVLQLEGKKTWKLHNPRHVNEKLARFSSGNFTQKEVGPAALEVTLSAGDILYFPRGMIHQAMSPDEEHSLHLTISTNQKNTWGDLLTKLLPLALEKAMAGDVRYRAGLPPGYLRYMGEAVRKSDAKEQRVKFCAHAKKLLEDLVTKHVPLDAACDEMGKQLVHDSLPPTLADGEALLHVSSQGEAWCQELGEVINASEVSPDTELRLVRASCVRLVPGGDGEEAGHLYHSLTNTRFYHEVEPTFSAVSQESKDSQNFFCFRSRQRRKYALPCVEKLLKAYPNFVRVEDFPLSQLDEKINVAAALYDMGLVISRVPLESCEETASEEEELE